MARNVGLLNWNFIDQNPQLVRQAGGAWNNASDTLFKTTGKLLDVAKLNQDRKESDSRIGVNNAKVGLFNKQGGLLDQEITAKQQQNYFTEQTNPSLINWTNTQNNVNSKFYENEKNAKLGSILLQNKAQEQANAYRSRTDKLKGLVENYNNARILANSGFTIGDKGVTTTKYGMPLTEEQVVINKVGEIIGVDFSPFLHNQAQVAQQQQQQKQQAQAQPFDGLSHEKFHSFNTEQQRNVLNTYIDIEKADPRDYPAMFNWISKGGGFLYDGNRYVPSQIPQEQINQAIQDINTFFPPGSPYYNIIKNMPQTKLLELYQSEDIQKALQQQQQ